MKGILLNTTELDGKKYKFNDVTKGIVASTFPTDKFYGGRVTRFGKTADGLTLCLEKNLENVIDIFIDFDSLLKLSKDMLQAIAEKVKVKKFAITPLQEREQIAVELEIKADATKKELADFIMANAIEIISE